MIKLEQQQVHGNEYYQLKKYSMYYSSEQEDELGFDAFIAPDDFDHTAQPVDIYTKFKYWYPLNNQARYIYYYSDGNYPLTLTPTADEYYKYGYTQGGSEIVVDVALNAAPVTIFGETLTTKRWVIVYNNTGIAIIEHYSLWIYCSSKIYQISQRSADLGYPGYTIKYIHLANLNSLLYIYSGNWYSFSTPIGTLTYSERMADIGRLSFQDNNVLTKVMYPQTKNVVINWDWPYNVFNPNGNLEYNLGASTYIPNATQAALLINVRAISVSLQNTAYASFPMCDIIYTKDLTTLYWLAPKTTRGLTLPDQLPQAQITALGTKLSTNIMQGYPLYIGTQITDLTNLYLSNKSFSTIEVGVGNTAFSVENGMLRSATNLIKAGTSNTGDLIIPNVQTIEAGCFLRCTGYTGNLTIPNTVTSVAAGVFSGLTNLTTLTLPVGFDTNVYNQFGFANFTAASLNTAIQNLASGTVGTPRYFYISKTSFDALNVAYPSAVSDAALRFINVRASIIQDSSLKLWLDAGNTLNYPGSGTVWNDLSGNGNNGTLVNGVAFNSANGGVMSFDGVDDYVQLPSNILIENISFYLKLSGNINKTIIYCPSPDNTIQTTLGGNFQIYPGGTSSYVVPINTFINITINYNVNKYDIYINNVYNSSITAGRINARIIGRPSGGIFGLINDILIYNRALTDSERTQNFEVTRSKYGI